MSLRPGQRLPRATAISGPYLTAEMRREHSDTGGELVDEGHLKAVCATSGLPRKLPLPMPRRTAVSLLQAADDQIVAMETKLQSKEAELDRCNVERQQILDRLNSITLELMELKKSSEEVEQCCKAACMRAAERELALKDNYIAMQRLQHRLATCYGVNDQLMEESRATGQYSAQLPNFVADMTRHLLKAVEKKAARKHKMKKLTAELEDSKKDLDEKSQLYQNTVDIKMALEEQLGELQQRVECLTADNAKCQDKMHFLAQEHSTVVTQRDGLQEQLRLEKEEKAVLEDWLKKLAGGICTQLDVENTSSVVIMENFGNVLGELLLELNTLRDEKVANDGTIKLLTADKVALMADKEALEDKVKGLDELQKIKEHLEAEVKALMETNEKMAQDFRDSQRKMLDSLEQLQHENGETAAAVEEFSHDVLLDLLGLRQDSRDLHFNTTHLRNRVAELDDEGVQKDMELQRLNGVCVNYASTIWALKAENERLYEGVTNFEQLASATTSDLEQAKSEVASLKEALAQAEAIPVEERERAAWLLLEKETHASELEKKLKELEEALEQLTKEKTDACDTANELRRQNENLQSALLIVTCDLRQLQEQQENKVDHGAQTEESEKVDSFVQTEDGIMADDFDVAAELSPFSKMDTEVQTDTSDDEVFAKENESIIAKEKNACLALQAKVRELMNQVAAKSAEADKHQKTISSLQESFQSQLEEAQKNEQLKKAEVLKLKEKVRTLSFELNNAKETGARNLERMEKLYKEAKEEVQFMKKVAKPMVQQRSTTPAAVESAVGPIAHETMFTPELTKTPLESRISWTAAKPMAPTAPPHDTQEAGASSSSGESLSVLVNQIEMMTSTKSKQKESNALAGANKEESTGKHTERAKTEKKATPPKRGKKPSTPATSRKRGPKKTRRGEASREASPCDIDLFAEAPEAPAAAHARSGSARTTTESSVASPPAKNRRFFKSTYGGWNELFKM
ncbi:uncharacterized protein LOC119164054 isoform X3 [Rhipicephalus microplus]